MSSSTYSDSSDSSSTSGEEKLQKLTRLNDWNNYYQTLCADDEPRVRKYIKRDRVGAEQRLMEDYFGPAPKYPERFFRRRYRMSSALFLSIVEGITNYNIEPIPAHFMFFKQRPDCRGLMSISPIMKCTSAIRQLAYGSTPDAFDEYLQIGERCSRECLDNFTKCKWDLFSEEFLRKPTFEDINTLYAKHESYHGFPGMLGRIDCMHWEWIKCPTALKWQYKRGDHKYPTLMLEAVASQDLWIWHAFFGVAGSNNDLNVLSHSNLFDDLIDGVAPEVPFTVNGKTYAKGYYLADEIYPTWSTFVKTYAVARNPKDLNFKKAQESARKDVERAFGVLQGRWGIIQHPARAYSVNKIRRIMYCCILLHNMILKDQEFAISEFNELYVSPQQNLQRTWVERCDVHRKKYKELRDKVVHNDLRRDIVEHLWQLKLERDAQDA